MMPRTAKVARIIAFVGLPLGWFLGFLLSVGQDLAGAGMVQGFGILLGLAVSVVAGAVYLLARSNPRLPQFKWSAIRANAGKITVTAAIVVGLIALLYQVS